jgi:protein-tyrosine phosphatase
MNANEVIPGLYQGSKPEPGCYDADVIILMAEEYQPRSHYFPCTRLVVHAPIDDNPAYMKPDERDAVVKASDYAARALRAGQRVLITCNMGLNRSGVVTALTLRRTYGMSPDQAIGLVRRARGPHALSNPQFEHFIRRS